MITKLKLTTIWIIELHEHHHKECAVITASILLRERMYNWQAPIIELGVSICDNRNNLTQIHPYLRRNHSVKAVVTANGVQYINL